MSHWNKLLKGSLVRWLLTEQPDWPEALRRLPAPARLPLRPGASDLDGDRRRRRAARRPVGSPPCRPAHFSIAGIPVRVEPVFPRRGLFGLRLPRASGSTSSSLGACTFVSILVHELGHGFALKVFGQPSAIVLHGFGGVTISQRRVAAVTGPQHPGQPGRLAHRA